MLSAITLDSAVLLAILATGYLAGRLLLRDSTRLEALSILFPLGSGLLTWLFFLVGWMGIAFDRLQVVLIWFCLNGVLLALLRVLKIDIGIKRQQTRGIDLSRDRFDIIALITLGVGFIIAVWLAIGRSYSVYDGIAMWAPKGYGIALENSIWGARWGNHGYSYPLHVHFLIATFKLFSGDVLPGSKVIFPVYFISMLLGIYSFWKNQHVKAAVRLPAILILASVPTLFVFSTIGYANLPMSAYLTLAVLWAIDGIETKDPKKQLISSLFLGFTVWTTIEGVLYAGTVVAAIIVAWFISRKGAIKPLAWLPPLIIIGGSWLLFFKMYGSGGSQAMTASGTMWQALLRGEWHFPEIRLILGYARRNVFAPGTWGLIYPLGILLFISGWRTVFPRVNFPAFTLLVATIMTASLSLALFYLRSFAIPGLYDLLERGFPRGFITPTILFFVVALLAFSSFIEKYERHSSV